MRRGDSNVVSPWAQDDRQSSTEKAAHTTQTESGSKLRTSLSRTDGPQMSYIHRAGDRAACSRNDIFYRFEPQLQLKDRLEDSCYSNPVIKPKIVGLTAPIGGCIGD
jgi:hypothetical protein